MRKIFILSILVFFGLHYKATSQVTVNMSSLQVDSAANASVDVTVNGFTNLVGLQFSINYDSLKLEFVSVTNTSPLIRDLSVGGSFGLPGVGSVKKGQMRFLWSDPGMNGNFGVTVPSGTRMYTLNFKAIGCGPTDVITSNKPLIIKIGYAPDFDEDENLINNKGIVTVKCGAKPEDPCPIPACTNPDALTFTGAKLNVEKNQTVKVPITVKNFRMIQSGGDRFTWDKAVLEYVDVTFPTNGIPGFNSGNTFVNTDQGFINFAWFNNNPLTPITLPDNTVIMEFTFKVIGNVGDIGCILFGKGTPPEWTTDAGEVPLCFSFGRVTVVDKTREPIVLKIGSGQGQVNDIVCVDVRVDKFIDVLGLQVDFTWNPAHLELITADMYDLVRLDNDDFNELTNGVVRLSWSSPDFVTLPDNHRIFRLCFRVLQCVPTTPINVGALEVSATANTPLPSSSVGGAITCIDAPPLPCKDRVCTVGTKTNPTCNKRTDGSINLSVTGGVDLANCTCLWKLNGNIVKPSGSVTAGCNLTGVGAGTYTYEVICGGTICCTGQETLTEPSEIFIPVSNVITDKVCGQLGAIDISATSGGNGGFTYNWNPTQGNTANPTNLNVGNYAVTVTDSKLCTATASFEIKDIVTDLTVKVNRKNVLCKGDETGEITVEVTGGCPPYTVNGPVLPVKVKAGNYNITVTDASVPPQQRIVSALITEPAELPSITVVTIKDASTSTSTDGGITISAAGVTGAINTKWAGPTFIADNALTSSTLRAGTYSVTVTDANGCTAERTGIIVNVAPLEDIPPTIGSSSVASDFNGFGVSCFGEDDGEIRATITGTYPIKVDLKLGASIVMTVNANGPDVSFKNLRPGTYTIEASNSKGTVVSTPLIIREPSRLAATTKIDCTEENGETGVITVTLNNTGVGNYTFNWSIPADNSNILEDLPKGFYNLTITDANDCELRITNLQVRDCSTPEGACYEASTIISPNGDFMNDFFVINCVEDEPSDLTVFDRYGRLVYSKSNYDNTWEGVDNNNTALKEGGYIWVLNVNFGQGRREIYKGTVTILTDK